MSYENFRPTTRRRFLHGLAAASSLPILASLRAQAQSLGGVLRFGTWGGTWRDAIEQLIGASWRARGVDLRYVIGNPSNNLARLIAARGRETPIDCLEDEQQTYVQFMQGKFLQELDLTRISNAAALPSFAKSKFFVATSGVELGIVYNTQKFSELGIAEPKSFADLANPKLAGRVSFSDIGVGDHLYLIVGLAYEAGGNETQLEKALPLIAQINPAVYHTSSTDLATRFASGEIWAAPWQAGYVVRMKRAGVPVAISYPKYGAKVGCLALTYYHIVAGTKNLAAAEALADLYLAPETQFEFAKLTGALPMNPIARTRLAELPELKNIVLTSDAELANMLQVDFANIDMNDWQRKWERRRR